MVPCAACRSPIDCDLFGKRCPVVAPPKPAGEPDRLAGLGAFSRAVVRMHDGIERRFGPKPAEQPKPAEPAAPAEASAASVLDLVREAMREATREPEPAAGPGTTLADLVREALREPEPEPEPLLLTEDMMMPDALPPASPPLPPSDPPRVAPPPVPLPPAHIAGGPLSVEAVGSGWMITRNGKPLDVGTSPEGIGERVAALLRR